MPPTVRNHIPRLRWGLLTRRAAAWAAVLLALSAPHAAAPAQEPCDEALLRRVQERYNAIGSFRGRFAQVDRHPDGREASAEGTLAYARPGRMRWEYEPPNEQLLVTDGETVWLYDPLLENVTIQPLSDLTRGTPLAFLLGAGNLTADFACRPPSRPFPADALRYMELVPRQPIPTLAYIQIGVRPDDAMIGALRMVDRQGSVREVRLEQLRFGVDFAEGFFVFDVGENMEVIRK